MRKIVLTLLLAAATAAAGPLTIQTQETVWSNGLDTITLDAVTFDVGNPVAIPYEVIISGDPTSRSIPFPVTVPALFGDNADSLTLAPGGVFLVGSGQFMFAMSFSPPQTFFTGSELVSVSGGTGLVTGATGQTITGNLNLQSAILAPEPSTWLLLAGGLFALQRMRHTRK